MALFRDRFAQRRALRARLASGYRTEIAELKNETWLAEGSNELINRQFVRFLIRFFPLRKFSPFIMVLILIVEQSEFLSRVSSQNDQRNIAKALALWLDKVFIPSVNSIVGICGVKW